MRRDYSDELSPEVREKMKKNLVYLGIFSVVMIFAGFTSAYIVSMGDTFWVKYPLPTGFWISTTFIIISSIFYHFACKNAKKQQVSTARLLMLLTLIFGIGFSVFQFVGYKQLIKDGAAGVSPIFVVDGRYGDYFEVKYQGKKVLEGLTAYEKGYVENAAGKVQYPVGTEIENLIKGLLFGKF